MIYVVFSLIYLIGGAWTFTCTIACDEVSRARLEGKGIRPTRLPRTPRFDSYLFCYGLLWPITIWLTLYVVWQESIRKE